MLAKAVREGKNILAGGSTDTGKTTLLNALSREIPRNAAVLTIEDTLELNLIVPNWRQLETNAQKGLTATVLVEYGMRASPDRILVGELRGREAAAFLEAANTGHSGCMASLHCNSAYDALARLEVLVLRADLGWPLPAIRQQIASTIDLVIHMARINGKRVLSEVAEIKSYIPDLGRYELDYLYKLRAH
jgi:pilus assembly protein CpaF